MKTQQQQHQPENANHKSKKGSNTKKHDLIHLEVVKLDFPTIENYKYKDSL